MYNQIYGKWSLGTGDWLSKKNYRKTGEDIFNNPIIDSFKTLILQDVLRMNLKNKLRKMSIMDVGNGRQALAFESLGAKKIDLYDISRFNYLRFNKFKKKIHTKINCYNVDICSNDFLKIRKKYDLIYLNGIIQHTKSPHKAIYNLKKKLKPNGIIWLYFYNLGNVKNIYIHMIKRILSKKKVSPKLIYNYFSKKFNPIILDGIMDSACCDYAYIYPSSYYLSLMSGMGFKMIYSKDIYKNKLPSLRVFTPSCLSAFKIVNPDKNFKKITPKYDVLDSNRYCSEDSTIINKLYNLRNIIDEFLKYPINKKIILKACEILFRYNFKDFLLRPYNEKCEELEKSFNKIVDLLKKSKFTK